MPALARGKDGCIGVRLAAVADQNGAQNPAIVPASLSLSSPYPVAADGSDATPVSATSGNVANAVAAAAIPAVVGKTAYITGFDIEGSGATAGLVVSPTMAGVISGTKTYAYAAAAGVLLANQSMCKRFNPPIPASGPNAAITVSCPALGAGNTNNTVNAYGFYL